MRSASRVSSRLQAALTILMIPVMVNLAFGPSIYAFWKHKKSRFAIATITVLGLVVPSLVLGIWAIRREVDFPNGRRRWHCRKS
jgi:hypothetical protein